MKTHKLLIALLILMLTLALSACHEHNWTEANCLNPKSCQTCDATEGSARGHAWKEATCTTPKTCTVCGETEGDVVHNWQSATCTTPKTCNDCGKTQGNPTAHKWLSATCSEPRTCKDCGETKGNPANHQWLAATCTDPKTCKACGATEGGLAEHNWKAATCIAPKTCTHCKKTEGSTTNHSWKAATCTTPKTCSVCYKTEGGTANHNWKAATCTTPKTCTNCYKTEGSATSHNWKDATCKAPKTCSTCGRTEGSKGNHSYSSGTCIHCGASDPNYVPTFSVGQKWVVAGKFEFTINAVIRHNICSDNYSKADEFNSAVIIDYTYKNLGSDKLEFTKWDFEVYDASGAEADPLYFEIYCDHGIGSKSCISGGSCNAKLPVAVISDGNSVTIFVEKDGKTATFKINVTEPKPGDIPVDYSRVKGEITYKYNNFVGTRGDDGAKIVFIPKNTALKAQDNNMAMMLINGEYDSGIIVKKCDGYGKFDTGDEVIAAGEYIVIVVSNNTTRSSAATAAELRTYLGNYISDKDLDTLALFIGFNKVAIDSLTLKDGYVHTISHDFGITYF